MRVLVLESDPHCADSAVQQLRDAGHDVARCHESGLPAFPCNALCDDRDCPLDSDAGIDVMLDIRAHPRRRPTPYEDGVSCAARRHIPLVIGGASAFSPFEKWTTAVVDGGSVVDTCERAASAPIESLAEVARDKVRQLLADDPAAAGAVDVVVTRGGGRLEAVVVLPEGAEELEGSLAVGVAGAIRTLDHWTPLLDVCVKRSSGSAS